MHLDNRRHCLRHNSVVNLGCGLETNWEGLMPIVPFQELLAAAETGGMLSATSSPGTWNRFLQWPTPPRRCDLR